MALIEVSLYNVLGKFIANILDNYTFLIEKKLTVLVIESCVSDFLLVICLTLLGPTISSYVQNCLSSIAKNGYSFKHSSKFCTRVTRVTRVTTS